MSEATPGRCVGCGGELGLFGPRQGYEYHECTRCGTLQLWPMPDQRALEEAYENEYATAEQVSGSSDPEIWRVACEPYRRDLLDLLIDHRVDGKVVDFGCGYGYLCELLIENGFDCRGVEPSAQMAELCRRKGLPVEQGSLEVIEATGGGVSTIVMCAVFEHLSAHDTWLRRFNRLLPAGGLVVTLHPTAACYRLLGRVLRLGSRRRELPELHGTFSPPWHTALFSIAGMEACAGRNGFRVLDVRPVSQGRMPGWTGAVQRAFGLVNRVGGFFAGPGWPLYTSHVFALEKTAEVGPQAGE